MASCLALKLAGAGGGVVAGGGATGSSSACLPGTRLTFSYAFCNSACAFFALASRGLGKGAGGCGLGAELRGECVSGRKLNRGRSGLARTLQMKTADNAGITAPKGEQGRARGRQGPARGSWERQ